jgi:methionyl-tRNA formyltransferase
MTYKLTILSDATSWLNAWLPAWCRYLQGKQHQINWIHHVQELTTPGDFLFLLSCSQVLPAAQLALHRHNLVVHESDLPKGRGWSPLTWQVLEGKNQIPVTLFEAAESVDSGAIYGQTAITLSGTELVDELRQKQAEATFRLCQEFIQAYPAVTGKPQTGKPSYYARRRPADSQLDPHKTLAEQFDLLRVVDNDRYPAYFDYRGQRYQLHIHAKPVKE